MEKVVVIRYRKRGHIYGDYICESCAPKDKDYFGDGEYPPIEEADACEICNRSYKNIKIELKKY